MHTSPENWLSAKFRDGTVTVADAEAAIAGGADIRGSALLEQAALAQRADLVKIFVENGANVWASPSSRSRGKTFSLFAYTIDEWCDVGIFELCLARYGAAPADARAQMRAFAERQRKAFIRAMYSAPNQADAYGVLLEKIAAAGVFDAETSREYLPREIRTDALRELVLGAEAGSDYLQKIETLIAHGADPSATAPDGRSLLCIAQENGWGNTAKTLEKFGAKLTAEEAEAAKKAEEQKSAETEKNAGTKSSRIRRGKIRKLGE